MGERAPEADYLRVDAFLKDLAGARVLGTALELRLIDFLVENQPVQRAALVEKFQGDQRGIEVLLDLLEQEGILQMEGGSVFLTSVFEKALHYRDLLEAKLEFARVTAPDLLEHFTALVHSPEVFQRRARIFDLFRYDRAEIPSPENLERTRVWMRLTTALTRYEAQVLLKHYDVGGHRLALDVGGNSGELALWLCRANPDVHVTVLDLPLVCRVGREHVGRKPEAHRINFVEGNALEDPLPAGFDLICFKSMLHDWPDAEALHLLDSATGSLAPGGTLLIFERQRPEKWPNPLPYSLVPFFLFFRSYRAASFYEARLNALGFREIKVRRIDLDMPFMLVAGAKASGT